MDVEVFDLVIPHKGDYEHLLDIGLEIQRHILRLRLATVLNMMTNILEDRDYRKDYLCEVCCNDVQGCDYCFTECLVDKLNKTIQEALSEINSEEFSSGSILGSCQFNIGNPDIDDLKQKLSNSYNITLLTSDSKQDLRYLINHYRVRQNLCNSTNISTDIPSIVYSTTNFIMKLLEDTLLIPSFPRCSSKLGNSESPQNPLWVHVYRYFIKQAILCRNDGLPYRIDIKVVAHKHNIEIPYLLIHYLVYEGLIYGRYKDIYVDFDDMIKTYRELYLKYSSSEIIKSLITIHQKLNQVGKNRVYDVVLSIVDYINEKAEATKNLNRILGENLGLGKDEVECFCYIINLLKSSNLLKLIGVTVLPDLLFNLPYQLLYILLIVSAIPYQWLVLPSISIEGDFWQQEDISWSEEDQEVDALLLGYLPEVQGSKIAFMPSVVALEIKLTDISKNLENGSFLSLLSKPQLEFLDMFNKICKESYSYGIKCVAAIAIPCGDSGCADTSSSIPTVCIENLVSESRFLISIIDLFSRFYRSTISTHFPDTLSSSMAHFWGS